MLVNDGPQVPVEYIITNSVLSLTFRLNVTAFSCEMLSIVHKTVIVSLLRPLSIGTGHPQHRVRMLCPRRRGANEVQKPAGFQVESLFTFIKV